MEPEKAEKRTKKRKLDEEGKSAVDSNNDGPGTTNPNPRDQSLDVALSQDAVLRDGNNKEAEAKMKSNGVEAKSIEKAATKASRKAQKERKKQKAQKEATNGVASEAKDEDTLPDSVQVHEREAALVESKGSVDGIEDAGTKENGEVSGKAARKAEKEEKKRLKALKKAQASGGVNLESNPSVMASERKPLPSSSYSEDPALTSLLQTKIDSFLSDSFISITDPSSTTPLRPIIDFAYLPTATKSHSLFADFKAPTPIQAAAWPFLLSNRDVIGVAETGSGKTLAFGVPCIRSIILSASIKPKPKARPIGSAETKAVIVSPTRELAIQIHEQIEKLAAPARLSTACIYGGVPKDSQRAIIKTAHIIVATPGRLNDFLDEGAADLSVVKYLVLDEADRMLDKGFENDIRKIISCCPSTSEGRQTLMFTATWPPSVRELAATFMNEPVHIRIGDDNPSGELRANKSITQKVEVVEPEAKQARLLQIIKEHQGTSKTKNDRILIFCLYKKEATRVEGYLHSKGLKVAGIHGDMNQHKRMESLEAFKSGACPLLVATDVAARGLDIPAVKLVLNVTFPLTVEDYVHRIGRYALPPLFPSPSLPTLTFHFQPTSLPTHS